MSSEINSKLLAISRRVAAIAQSGLYYSRDQYDFDRYSQLQTIAAEILACASEIPSEQIRQILLLEAGHATPKVDVRGACFDEKGQILLVKELSDECWALPGGWAEVGLSPVESVIKELREEAALEVTVAGIVGVFDEEIEGVRQRIFHEYKIIFNCTVTGAAVKGEGPEEILETGYFPETSLPPLSKTRTSMQQVLECFKHRNGKNKEVFFN
jgi:ADP-ribose pyrophosphatase YjhB (NUDIX family)